MRSNNTIILLSATLYLIISVIGLQISNKYRKSLNTKQDKNTRIVFQKEESWGPCSAEKEPCLLKTTLYSNGKLIREGQFEEAIYINKDRFRLVQSKISQSDIFLKDCGTETVLGYYASYKIRLGDNIKEIVFPGCFKELSEIEHLLPLPKQEIQF